MKVEVKVRIGDAEPLLYVHDETQEWTVLHAKDVSQLVRQALCPHDDHLVRDCPPGGPLGRQHCGSCGKVLPDPPADGRGS